MGLKRSANSGRHFHRFVILFFLSLPDENLIYELLINLIYYGSK